MTEPNTQPIARLTGFAYLGIIVSGIFAEFFVRMSLVKAGDAAATATNIARSGALFRAGIAADVLMVALDITVAIGFYLLLRRVDRTRALLAMAFRLIQAAVLAANLMNLASALYWANAGVPSSATGTAGSQALVLATMDVHGVVYDLALIFFGLSCVVLGQVLRASRLVPGVFGLGLTLAGVVYLVGSLATVLAPDIAPALDPMYGLTLLAELGVALWLATKGIRTAPLPKAVMVGVALVTMACGAPSSSKDNTSAKGPEDELAEVGRYVELGHLGVGYQRLSFVDASGNSKLVKAWYPTAPQQPAPDITYEVSLKLPGWPADAPAVIFGHADADAPIHADEVSYPLVIFSHGFGMNPEWYSQLVERLASHGFIVLAPEHDEGDWLETVVAASFARPFDVKGTIDLAEELTRNPGPFEGRIDLQRVAVVGHSYGGYTALAAAGARVHPEALAAECANLEETDPRMFLCRPFMVDPATLAEAADLDAAPERWPAQSDQRVRAIVTIAGDAYLFGQEGLAHVTIPTLAIGGTADTGSPWEWGAQLTYDSVSSERAALVGFEGADHMIPVNTCDALPWTDELPEEFQSVLCGDPAWDRDEALGLVGHFTIAFLRDVLAHDPAARAALEEQNIKPPSRLRYAASH